mgnify:FL=1
MNNGDGFVIDGLTLVLIVLGIGVLLLLIVIIRLLSNRKSLREEHVTLASRIKDSQTELTQTITNFTIEFRDELRAHDQRIQPLEHVYRRWGGGHLVDRDIKQLQVKEAEHEDCIRSIRKVMHDIRDSMQKISLDVASSVGEVKEATADLKARVETWETCLKEKKPE